MSNDLISRSALFNELFVRNGKVCPNTDVDNFPITFDVKDIKDAIRNAPAAYDADKVVEQFELLSENAEYNNLNTSEEKAAYNTAYLKAIEIVKAGGINE